MYDSHVERIFKLSPLDTPGLSPDVQVLRAAYRRKIPPHYQGNPLTSEYIRLNVLLVPGGRLLVPEQSPADLSGFYRQLRVSIPDLYRRVISPVGTARLAAMDDFTPIKQITTLELDGQRLPGEAELYGWHDLESQAARQAELLQLTFQSNGLYFNRGSAFYSRDRLLLEPDNSLSDAFCTAVNLENAREMGIRARSMMRPLCFFLQGRQSNVYPFVFRFRAQESYMLNMRRLAGALNASRAALGFSASPPLVLPGKRETPHFLSLQEVLAGYHANDIRHSLYCPYDGVVLLYPELSRAQSLHPHRLARSLSGRRHDRVCLTLVESLLYFSVREIQRILEHKGYAGRFHLREQRRQVYLYLNPLEGVYSHLLPFVTRSGQFGLIQTSGTHRNITGNDGPTINQLREILRDLNVQDPFASDPFMLVVSGSQGNDVPNLVARDWQDLPGLLYQIAPTTSLDRQNVPRGPVTTPRIGLSLLMSG